MADGIEMDEFLKKWLKQVKDISTDLTPKEKERIASAGGQVFKDKLTQTTREKHYSNHNDRAYGHAADNIDLMKSDVDGDHNGNVTVGWNNHYHAMNMMRLNDGYKGYTADHFITNLIQDNDVSSAVLKAESEEYQKMIKEKGGDE